MAEELLETVDRLQSRLQENPEPRKLLKTLKRLGELPMTVDILVETGVGKTVNSFRKHEVAGEVAKSLVAKWKKLVPQSADRPNSHAKEVPRSHTHSRGPEAGGGGGHRRIRESSPVEEPLYEEEEEEEEERGYHTNYSPSPPRQEQYSPPQRGGYQSDEYASPEPDQPEPEPSPPPPRKEVRHAKPNKEPSKNHHHHGLRTSTAAARGARSVTWKSSLGLQMMAGEPPKWPPEKNGSAAAKTGPALGRRPLVVSKSVREPAETPAPPHGTGSRKTQELQNAKVRIDRHYWQTDPPAPL
ncbi:transcription elongation factor B polypeptide 3 [Lates japonicus]|uniref:Transcription elongation factor B polypeptide 3 n=1 Tax=Lates japonicus TaxID=270547 RepID=A0AAD3QV68_LATJO|nr:transcription elongation factor B polypeptide 3 [Lates japonicus]